MRTQLLALTAACLLAACGTEPAPPPPPFAGKIVFASNRANFTEGLELYTMNPDGSDIRRIPIPLPAAFGSPDISPDGERVAFVRDGIYTVGGNGTDLQHPLLSGGFRPAWSPDGTQLAYEAGAGMSYDLWVMNRSGGQQTNLTNTPNSDEFAASWSPDGTLLVYSRQPVDLSTPTQLWTIGRDGTGAQQITTDPDNDAINPAFSPDGHWIAYARGPGYLTDLRLIRPDGTDDHSIFKIDDGTALDSPSWAPDGQSLVISYGLGIATIHADGTGLRVLTDSAYSGDPDWSPAVK